MKSQRKVGLADRIIYSDERQWTGCHVHAGHIKAAIGASPRFFIDEPAQFFWKSEQQSWEMGELGPVRPPFDSMWVEYRMPEWSNVEGKWVRLEADMPKEQGAWVQCTPAIDETYKVTVLQIYGHKNSICVLPLIGYQVTDQGVPINTTRMPLWWTEGSFQHIDFTDEDLRSGVIGSIKPFVFSIGFMNCRNVNSNETTTSLGVKIGRKRRPGLRYRLVKLPNSVSPSNSKSDTVRDSEPLAWHLVRGHFKTYTDENPLFGQHTGTWWWGHQVRGSTEHGAVIKDYEVTA